MKRLRSGLLFPLLPVALALAGCSDDAPVAAGGGGGGGGGGAGAPVALTGQVVKGLTANALITVYAPSAAGGFTQIDSTLSSASGAYSLTLPAGFTGAIKIVASPSAPPAAPTIMRCDANAGCGTFANPADSNDLDDDGQVDFGEWSPVAADFSLRAVAAVDGTGVRLINLTPLSSVAADWAEEFPQGLDADSATIANTQAAVTFGFAASDLEQPLSDVADPLWLNLADAQQIKLAVFMATFSELAQHFDFNSQTVIDMVSAEFSDNQGRLQELSSSDPTRPTVFNILSTTVTLAGVLDLPDIPQAEIVSSMNAALADLQDGRLSLPIETTPYDFLDRLGPLGDDIDELVNVTGLNQPLMLLTTQAPYFDWVLSSDNLQLLPLAVDTVVYTAIGSAYVGSPAALLSSQISLYDDGVFTVVVLPRTKKLLMRGQRHNQEVDFTIDLVDMRAGITSKAFSIGMVGTISNATASGRIDGRINVNTGDTDLSTLTSVLDALESGEWDAANVDSDPVKQFIQEMLASANGSMTLTGEAYLVRNSDPEQVLGGNVTLDATLNMAAAEGETIATLNVTQAELLLPNGNRLHGLEDKAVLTVVVADDATLVLDGAGQVLNLPEATAHAQGTLLNSRALFKHIQNTLQAALAAPALDIGGTIAALFDFSPRAAGMEIHGTGVIDIPGMPSGRDHQYRAALDNFTLKLFQPHSDEVALTVALDIDKQVAHMDFAGEKWNMSVMTTPTPRLMLLGPAGQFAEASQEDLFAFLNVLPLDSVFPALAAGEPAACVICL